MEEDDDVGVYLIFFVDEVMCLRRNQIGCKQIDFQNYIIYEDMVYMMFDKF